MSNSAGDAISIVEVGPRDGLQNEKGKLTTATRASLIARLTKAGVSRIEIGSFVSPRWVPQMAGSAELTKKVLKLQAKGEISANVKFACLVPNAHGMQDAVASGIQEVSVFTAASEAFTKKNTNCTIEESFQRIKEVIEIAKQKNIRVRGYMSTCFYCPYTGKVKPELVVELCERLAKMGCYEISIGDTIGAATPNEVRALTRGLSSAVGVSRLAMHFHDTRGTALANILASLDLGVRTFDASIGGLGGCPYAPGAAGNVATEDVVYMVEGMGMKTGISLLTLIKVNKWMEKQMRRHLPSRVGKAGLPRLMRKN